MEGPGINNYLVYNHFYWGHRVERIKCRQGSEDFPECIPGISFRRGLLLVIDARFFRETDCPWHIEPIEYTYDSNAP